MPGSYRAPRFPSSILRVTSRWISLTSAGRIAAPGPSRIPSNYQRVVPIVSQSCSHVPRQQLCCAGVYQRIGEVGRYLLVVSCVSNMSGSVHRAHLLISALSFVLLCSPSWAAEEVFQPTTRAPPKLYLQGQIRKREVDYVMLPWKSVSAAAHLQDTP